jgi:hypothetical protein
LPDDFEKIDIIYDYTVRRFLIYISECTI